MRPLRVLLCLSLLSMLLLVGGCIDKKGAQTSKEVDLSVPTNKQQVDKSASEMLHPSQQEQQGAPNKVSGSEVRDQSVPSSELKTEGNIGSQTKREQAQSADNTQVVIKTRNPVNSVDGEAAISEIDKELDRLVETLEGLKDVSSEDLE